MIARLPRKIRKSVFSFPCEKTNRKSKGHASSNCIRIEIYQRWVKAEPEARLAK